MEMVKFRWEADLSVSKENTMQYYSQ